jgi:hypothetical protein
MRTEEEVDKMISEMIKKTKGKYITQGTSFNKTCPRQMALLKKALMESVSFSGLVKEMLAIRFEESPIKNVVQMPQMSQTTQFDKPKLKNVGNFL